MKKNAKGFTLIELVIVIVIIGILSVIAVPLYRGYVRRAAGAEGAALVGSVASAEKAYFSEHGAYTALTNTSSALDINSGTNKFFTSFTVTGTASTFTVTTTGATTSNDSSGVTVTLNQPNGGAPTITVTGI